MKKLLLMGTAVALLTTQFGIAQEEASLDTGPVATPDLEVGQVEHQTEVQPAPMNEIDEPALKAADAAVKREQGYLQACQAAVAALHEEMQAEKDKMQAELKAQQAALQSHKTAMQAELDAQLAKLRQDFSGKLADLTARIDSLEQTVLPQIREQVASLDVRGVQIAQKIDQVENTLLDVAPLVKTLEATVNDVTTFDPRSSSSSGSRLAMLNNMSGSEKFRDEVYNTTRFRVRIQNPLLKTGELQVNGVTWRVSESPVSFVPVPYGPITISKPGDPRLVLQESDIQWKDDSRGFYVDYNYSEPKVPEPPSVEVPPTEDRSLVGEE